MVFIFMKGILSCEMDKFRVSVVKNKKEVNFLIKILNFSMLISFKFKIFKFDKEMFL
tara:strand:+ start:1136 stop:1306 length:171 start_codon:yes stop_codon:yes gene_type:complete